MSKSINKLNSITARIWITDLSREIAVLYILAMSAIYLLTNHVWGGLFLAITASILYCYRFLHLLPDGIKNTICKYTPFTVVFLAGLAGTFTLLEQPAHAYFGENLQAFLVGAFPDLDVIVGYVVNGLRAVILLILAVKIFSSLKDSSQGLEDLYTSLRPLLVVIIGIAAFDEMVVLFTGGTNAPPPPAGGGGTGND